MRPSGFLSLRIAKKSSVELSMYFVGRYGPVIKFTKEISINNRLNFLDVAIDSNGETYVTSVYRKETNKGHFMNARGECPERYKVGMIRGLIDRTHKISSSIEIFNVVFNKLKQLLIYNGYSNSLFDCVLKKYVQQKQSQSQETPNETHDLFLP